MKHQITTASNLLHSTNFIKKKSDEISRLKGEDFNIFTILDLESKENKTHSNFLFEILNPNGRHYFKDSFLKLFLKQLHIELDEYESESFEIQKEVSFSNGRMDLVISSKNFIAVIENKIFAIDQSEQLKRYDSYLKTSDKKIKILCYLTLDGRDASDDSKQDLTKDVNYTCISYKNDIKDWLELCLREVGDFPIIRETIKQYLILIKKLTGQLNSKTMEEELFKLITKDIETFEAAEIIFQNYNSIVNRLHEKEIQKLSEELLQKGFEKHQLSHERSGRRDGLFITLKSYEIENIIFELGINIELENNYYFFCVIEKDKNRIAHHNNLPKYLAIKEDLWSKVENLTLYNNWTIGKSENLKVGLDKNFYLPSIDNTTAYKVFAQTIRKYLDIFRD